jgi:hypothetical protein
MTENNKYIYTAGTCKYFASGIILGTCKFLGPGIILGTCKFFSSGISWVLGTNANDYGIRDCCWN